jgi:hypothetical protein
MSMKIRTLVSEFFYADGQTDTHDEDNSRFSQFCEGTWNQQEQNTFLQLQTLIGFFPELKQRRREVNHPPQSIAEIKNNWSYIFTQFLHDVNTDNFTFTCFYCIRQAQFFSHVKIEYVIFFLNKLLSSDH